MELRSCPLLLRKCVTTRKILLHFFCFVFLWVHAECSEGWLGPIPLVSLQGGHISITIARESAWVLFQKLLEDENVSVVLKIDATEGSIAKLKHGITEDNVPVTRWRALCTSSSHGNQMKVCHSMSIELWLMFWETYELFHLITTDKSGFPLTESLHFMKTKLKNRLKKKLPMMVVLSDDDSVIKKSFNDVFNDATTSECVDAIWDHIYHGT